MNSKREPSRRQVRLRQYRGHTKRVQLKLLAAYGYHGYDQATQRRVALRRAFHHSDARHIWRQLDDLNQNSRSNALKLVYRADRNWVNRTWLRAVSPIRRGTR